MDQTKAQDIIRHIFNDDDRGIAMMEKMSIDDAVAVMTKVLPELMKAAEKKNSSNDVGYFHSLRQIYEKVLVQKVKEAEHLWIVYCSKTSYPYMLDDDILVLYNYNNAGLVVEKLDKSGYDVVLGTETPEAFHTEIAHMYRNGYKNVRLSNGRDDMIIIPRESFGEYDQYFDNDYLTNPGLQNTMISFFQEFRREGSKENFQKILKARENLMLRAMVNADYMVPCIKEETDDQVSISHPFIDLTERLGHSADDKVIAIPAFTDGFEMEKCYNGQHENMLYKYSELLEVVDELGATGVVFNALGISHYMSAEQLREINL